MEHLEIETSRGNMSVIFESTPNGIVICNIPLIGTVTVRWKSIVAIGTRIDLLLADYEKHTKTPKTKKTKQL